MLVVGFGTSVLLARTAGPDGKGGYDLSIATVGLLVAALGLALPGGLGYVIAKGGRGARHLLVRLSAIAVVQGAAAVVVLLVVSLTPLAPAFLASGTGTALVLPIALLFTFTIIGSHERAILVGRQLFIAANLRDLAGRVLILVAVVVVAAAFLQAGQAPPAVPLVWAGAAAAAGLVILFATALPDDEGERPSANEMREIGRFAAPAYGSQLAQFLSFRLDLFLVGFFLTVTDIGLYALAVSLGQMLWLLSNAASVVLFPRVASSEDRAGRSSETARVCRIALGATIVGTLVLAVISPVAIPLLFGSRFAPSVTPLLLLLPGVVAFSVVNVLGSFVTGIGRPAHVMVVSLVGLAVTAPLDLLLIPAVGIEGAALASSVSYTAAALAMLWFFVHHSRVGVRETLLLRRSDLALVATTARRLRSGGSAGPAGQGPET